MKLFFDNLDREMKHLIGSTSVALQRGICVGDGQITGYFDLLENLLNGTPISVLISIGVALIVVVASTRHIRMSILAIVTIGGTVSATAATVVLLGWRISVVEATVITLTIGLSFDFTLHYAIACKMTSTMDHRDRRLRMAMSAIGLPVLLSALTTFVAGLAIIWSTTLAFYEIGVFMLLVTVYSYIFATFVFTSFVYVFSFFCENEITRL
uniref:Uncharacterized protein n=1 Tax=Plectus sambesii TaxID=2011161 RepID=A0A914WT51_9BILA